MASQGHKNQLKGTIGPIVVQQRYGKTIVRSKPSTMKQTKATKSSSAEFQYCSRWSKYLRMGLTPLWLENADSLVSQRLTGALYATLQKNTSLAKGERNWSNTDMSGINGFEVNTQSPFASYCKVEIAIELTASHTVKISLPQHSTMHSIRYPEDCTDAELVCCITTTKIATGEFQNAVIKNFIMHKSSNTLAYPVFESEPFSVDAVIVVAAQLVFYRSNIVSGRYSFNTKKINPCALLWVGV